jgi:transcriptional regulator with XRE-family HTH domain
MVYRYTFRARQVLQSLRLERGLTQLEVANKLNVTKAYISQIENGYRPLPRYRVLIALLEIYSIKPKYFEELIYKKTK